LPATLFIRNTLGDQLNNLFQNITEITCSYRLICQQESGGYSNPPAKEQQVANILLASNKQVMYILLVGDKQVAQKHSKQDRLCLDLQSVANLAQPGRAPIKNFSSLPQRLFHANQ